MIDILLQDGEIIKEWDKFVEETAYHIIHIGDFSTKDQYYNLGRFLYEQYPCIGFSVGKNPWAHFTGKLSQKIRNIRWKWNKRSSKSIGEEPPKKKKGPRNFATLDQEGGNKQMKNLVDKAKRMRADIQEFLQTYKPSNALPKIGHVSNVFKKYEDSTKGISEDQRDELTSYLCTFKEVNLSGVKDVPSMVHDAISFIIHHSEKEESSTDVEESEDFIQKELKKPNKEQNKAALLKAQRVTFKKRRNEMQEIEDGNITKILEKYPILKFSEFIEKEFYLMTPTFSKDQLGEEWLTILSTLDQIFQQEQDAYNEDESVSAEYENESILTLIRKLEAEIKFKASKKDIPLITEMNSKGQTFLQRRQHHQG